MKLDFALRPDSGHSASGRRSGPTGRQQHRKCRRSAHLEKLRKIYLDRADEQNYRTTMSVTDVARQLKISYRALKGISRSEVESGLDFLRMAYRPYPAINNAEKEELLDLIEDASDDMAFAIMLGLFATAVQWHEAAKEVAAGKDGWKDEFAKRHLLSCWWTDLFHSAYGLRQEIWDDSLMIRNIVGD